MLPDDAGKRMPALISRRSALRFTLRAPKGKPMKRRFVASSLAALALVFGAHAAPAAEGAQSPESDARLQLVTALGAVSPHSSLGDQAKVFSRLVGTWNVEYGDVSKNGTITHRSGQFIVGWVMDGRAIQGLWIVNPSGDRTDREVYAALSYFDAKTRSWAFDFVDAEHASVDRFIGGAVGEDRIVLTSTDFPGMLTRWSFNDVRPDSFVFRAEASTDGGTTWRLQSDDHMSRQRAAAGAR